MTDIGHSSGWFTEPTPFFTGGLSSEEASGALDAAMGDVMDVLADMPPAPGVLTVRLHVGGKDGTVQGLEWLADTLVPLPAGPDLPADQIRAGIQILIRDALLADSKSGRFPLSKDGEDTFITLPIVFE